ncbi:MAG: helix-turn-helix transcriptional regulator [Butyrivibrio sp.]|nr:helix-turn-helix transcriptional regulator [Butyrivibrio sp.]
MGKSRAFRAFEDNGCLVSFSSINFRRLLKETQCARKQKGEKISLDEICAQLADQIGVSSDAVRNWYKGSNGIGNLEMVKNLADALNIDYKNLIVKIEDGMNQPSFSYDIKANTEMDVIKRMYRLMIDFIYWFVGTSDNCKAFSYFEAPFDEMEKYIFEMYHCLDSERINLREDSYLKLRKTITELDYISRCSIPLMCFPEEWLKINPHLNDDDFCETLYNDTENNTEELWFEDIIDEPEALIHMYLEDMPELLSDKYKTSKKHGGKNRVQILSSLRMIPEYESSEIIVREVAYTLMRIMKQRFPDIIA